MSEMDAVDEVGQRSAEVLRQMLIAAGLVAEQIARHREQALRVATAATRGEAGRLGEEYQAERAIAVGRLTAVTNPRWWDTASREDIALAWQDAAAWRGAGDTDGRAARYAQRIAAEVRARYGVDPDGLVAPVPPVERVTAQARRDDVAAQVEATVLLGGAELDVGPAWDTTARREHLADRLRTAGVHPEAVEARLLSDLAQGKPPVEAVQPGVPHSAPVGAARGAGRARVAEHTPGR